MESLSPGDGPQLLSLPFDHYERYALTQRIVSVVWPRPKSPVLKILDVGGHSSPLKHFLPTHTVVLVDIQPPGSLTTIPLAYDTYVRATGTKLPFADLSFDLVTANDTLEHLPNADRPAFLQELLRVSRRFVIVNGPMFHPQTAEAEQRFARFLQRALLEGSDFLHEHIDLGLPKEEEIEEILNEQGLLFIGIPNGNLTLWLAMNTAKNYILAFPDADRLSTILDQTYNLVLSPRDFGGLCYRKAYVIAKHRGDANVIRTVETAFADDLSKPGPNWDLRAVETVLDAMEDHARRVRRDLAELRALLAQRESALQRQDALLAEKDGLLAEKDALVIKKDALLAEKDGLLAEKDALVIKKDALLAEKESRIASSEAMLAGTEEQLRQARQQFQVATSTIGYRLLERVRRVINRLAPPGTRRRGVLGLFKRGLTIILTEGWGTFVRRAVRVWRWGPRLLRRPKLAAQAGSLDEQYRLWLRAHALTPAQIRRIRKDLTRLAYRPKMSIIMPVYNSDTAWLREAIESVRAQLYDEWELCIADDGSTNPAVRAVLEDCARADERIKVTYLEENQGISAASNAALALATGEFVGFLDHDDELKPNALYEVAKLLNEQPALDFIYTDEDHRSPDGRLVQPFFKPDWSPDLLLSVNYVPHFTVYRKRLVDEVGGLRRAYDLSQDYDLTLRVTERTDRIGHIALPLYTWRLAPRSASADHEAKLRAADAGKRMLANAMQRRGIEADILDASVITTYRVRYRIQGQPLVGIVIPTRDRVDLLSQCIASIEKKSTYPNYEIVIVDNGSRDKNTLDYLKQSPHRCLAYPGPFRYAAMMNFAARETAPEYILFLNNDTEVIAPEWIEAMLEHCQRPEVGAVGARLLYPDGRLQHEGIIVGLAGGCAANVDHGGYFGLGQLVHNVTAVTGACMMTRRDVFERLGGFEENLEVAFNDVDYCLRALERGYLNVYTPYALLYHHEGGTRGWGIPEQDEMFFRNRWGNPGEYRDPYYNPNLDLLRPFTIRL